MKDGNNGVVAADDKATLPNEGAVAPEVEASKESAVELAAPNKGDSENDCAVAKEEETEDNTPMEGEGEEAVDDPSPKRIGDEPPPILAVVTEEVAGAAAAMEDEKFKGKSDPRLGEEEWVVDNELLKDNDETEPEEKVKVDVGEEEEVVTVVVAGAEVELKENGKDLGPDGTENKLLVAAIDELGFDEELKKDDEELKEDDVDEEEEPKGFDCEAEVAEDPKEKDGIWLAEAALAAVEEDEKIVEAGEETENGEEEDAKEPEEREKENPGDWEDDEEEVAEEFKEKGDAIQIRDGLLPRSTLYSLPSTLGQGFHGSNARRLEGFFRTH